MLNENDLEKYNESIIDNQNTQILLDWEEQNINLENIIDINKLIDDYNNNLDSDNDWVSDIYDSCPLINWSVSNDWCPIFSDLCSLDSDCDTWYFCNSKWECEIDLETSTSNLCNYNEGSVIYWNTICESCPCSNFLDFNSLLRECDIIFPAITSPENTQIYGKWDFYQIK